MRDQNETLQSKQESMPDVDSILSQLKESQFIVSEREAEIERIKEDFKLQLQKKQGEINDQASKIIHKDEYIKDLEEENDEHRGELEKISYETFIQVKNELFSKESANERLAERRHYLPIYEDFEKQTEELMYKYTQQESTI